MSASPSLFIVDEAGTVRGGDMEHLLTKISAAGGRAVLVGDPRQLAAVSAGSPFAQAIETGAMAVATISEIQRQSDQALRSIAAAFVGSRALDAVRAAKPYMYAVAPEAAKTISGGSVEIVSHGVV